MAQPGNLLLPQQVLGAERGAGVCTTGRVPFGGSVAEELLPVAKSSFNYHYYRDCLHHHNPAAGYSHQDAAGGGPACSGVRLCPESSTLGSQRTGCVFGVPQRCCRARGELGDPQTGSQKGGRTRAVPPIVGCALHCCAEPRTSSQPPLLAREGPPAPTVCAPAGLVPRPAGLKHVSLFCSRLPAGFSHLPNGLYPSYIPLSHLEPPSAGSPLLAQLGQHSLFESQKGEWGSRLAFPSAAPWCSTSLG